MRARKTTVAAVAGALVLATASVAFGAVLADFGVERDRELNSDARELYGVLGGIPTSSTADLTTAEALANPLGLAKLAPGLKARVVTAGKAAPVIDQMVLWPAGSPKYLIGCNEEGTAEVALQRIDLATGDAVTIVRSGLVSCDPVRVTPWGTVLFGEEAGPTGAMFEMIDPLSVTDATIDRTTGVTSSPNIRRVDAFGFLSFEGLAVLPNGVTYYGDELSANRGAAGGAYFKFVPTTLWAGGAPITSLDQSPYASGSVSGLRVGSTNNNGQGFSYGRGAWLPLANTTGQQLGALASANKLTGYYRPEDIDVDLRALAAGTVSWCGNNTGRDSARYFGETICVSDGTPATAAAGTSVPEVTLFVQGNQEINMPDNIAYQPGRANWIVHEDGSTVGAQGGDRNNDLWDCLADGRDVDTMSDGCIRVATLNDLDAEWTGGFFDPTGKTFYVSVQHNSSGFGTVLAITGWR
ncbi:alkaline phosphatase PhoX [Kineosporia sp. A_224]|uniref:alkaline phosphatase PhoX n=1 Tax=Kineosporia sp. A_224 TaxID=1962180 RepID=UPI000B4A902D|nr:alkaline phosphatase PhoX [Kineosporia sp. A_224]